MKRSPNTPTEKGVFIALVFQTVVSNVPAIAKMKVKNDSLKDFIVENKKEIAVAYGEINLLGGKIPAGCSTGSVNWKNQSLNINRLSRVATVKGKGEIREFHLCSFDGDSKID